MFQMDAGAPSQVVNGESEALIALEIFFVPGKMSAGDYDFFVHFVTRDGKTQTEPCKLTFHIAPAPLTDRI